MTKVQAPNGIVKRPSVYYAYDLGNLATKDTKGEYISWYAFVMCGTSATGACNKIAIAFPFTSGATLTLAKLGGYQAGLNVPSSAVCGGPAGQDANMTFALYTNNGGVPGTVIAGTTATLTGTVAWGTYGLPVTKTLKKVVQLAVSTEYWVVGTPVDAHTCVAWGLEDLDFVDNQAGAIGSLTDTGFTAVSFGAAGDTPSIGVIR